MMTRHMGAMNMGRGFASAVLAVIAFNMMQPFMVFGESSDAATETEISFEGTWRSPLPDNWEVAFEIKRGAEGEYAGTVITYLNGLQYMIQPTGEIETDGRKLHMVSNPEANVVFEGFCSESGDTLDGALLYADGSSMPLTLVRELEAEEQASTPRILPKEGYVYRSPTIREDGIDIASLEDLDMSRGPVDSLVNAIVRGDLGEIHSVLIAKDGRLVVEEYFYNYDMDMLHRLHSCTKSVVSLLAGIAEDMGKLPQLNETLSLLLPDWSEQMHNSVEKVSLSHLLGMTAGMKDVRLEMNAGNAWLDSLLGLSLDHEPGSHFRYDDNCSEIVGMLLKRAVGEDLSIFARRRLFTPLGIEEFDWEKHPNGNNIAREGLSLRPRDLLKIGLMVSQQGVWRGGRVVSESWIESSTRKFISVDDVYGYGHHWWTISGDKIGISGDIIAAQGAGGQRLYIIPQLSAVCVITGGNFDSYPPVERYLRDIILGS